VRGRVDDYHRTLSTYVNVLARHELFIEELAEPRGPSTGRQPAYDMVPPALVARCTTPAP
jgi:hypothetical protein